MIIYKYYHSLYIYIYIYVYLSLSLYIYIYIYTYSYIVEYNCICNLWTRNSGHAQQFQPKFEYTCLRPRLGLAAVALKDISIHICSNYKLGHVVSIFLYTIYAWYIDMWTFRCVIDIYIYINDNIYILSLYEYIYIYIYMYLSIYIYIYLYFYIYSCI